MRRPVPGFREIPSAVNSSVGRGFNEMFPFGSDLRRLGSNGVSNSPGLPSSCVLRITFQRSPSVPLPSAEKSNPLDWLDHDP